MKRTVAVALAITTLLSLSSASLRPVASQPVVRTVEIVVTARDRWAYLPSPLTVRVGETVEWVNRDPDDAHNVSIPDLQYDGRFLGYQESDQFTFWRPGRFAYLCVPHPSMAGLVIVVGATYLPITAKGHPPG
jgi:plastocyanin